MATITCSNCRQTFDHVGDPRTPCPACGTPLLGTPEGDAYRRGRKDLRLVARHQRRILWYVLITLAVTFLPFLLRGAGPAVPTGTLPGGISPTALVSTFVPCFVRLIVQILIVVGILQLLGALGSRVAVQIVVGILMFAPCVNLIVLLVVNLRATAALRAAGLKVGLFGVPDDVVVRHLSTNVCRGCGYDLTGNVSGFCPECGRPRTPPAAAMP